MNRLLASVLLLPAPVLALAQSAADEAPTEKASGLTVAIFVALFVGGIAAYGVYLWWRARESKKAEGK